LKFLTDVILEDTIFIAWINNDYGIKVDCYFILIIVLLNNGQL
jgi:hypothetical protein